MFLLECNNIEEWWCLLLWLLSFLEISQCAQPPPCSLLASIVAERFHFHVFFQARLSRRIENKSAQNIQFCHRSANSREITNSDF